MLGIPRRGSGLRLAELSVPHRQRLTGARSSKLMTLMKSARAMTKQFSHTWHNDLW